MALPIGVATVDVTIGVPVTFRGTNLATSVTVTPSADLVHTATGTPLVAMLEDLSISEGVQGVMTLPVTDQDGFQDLAGNAYKNWYYTITLQYSMKGKTLPPKTKVFQLPTGQGPTVDLDLIPSGNAQLAYIAPTLPVTSVVGKTGAVLGSDIAADPALSGTFESQAHASGTYVPLAQKGAASGVASLDSGAHVPDAQLPTRLSDASLSSTYAPASGSPNYDAAGAAAAAAAPKVDKASNLSDLASASAARTNLGLGDAATHPASDFLATVSKGVANGVASLDAGGLVAQYPRLHASRHGNGGADDLYGLVNAKLDYGAKGDGVTDDTTALQNFVNYCVNNGKSGFIPAGVYKITAPLAFSTRPQWSIIGAGVGTTTIKQFTDNVPVLNLGVDTVSLMHSFYLGNMALDYANTQPATNTNANCILYSTMVYEGKIEQIRFLNGSYATRVANGVGGPWGMTFDDLQFSNGLTLGAMDWTQATNAVPNNRFGRIFCDCKNMTGVVIAVRGYNFVIDCIEFIAADQGAPLFQLAAGGRLTVGNMKLENGHYNSTKILWDFQTNSAVSIGQLTVGGNYLDWQSGANVSVVSAGSGARVDIDFMDCTSAVTPVGAAYLFAGSGKITIGDYTKTNMTGLVNNGSSATAGNVTVRAHVNRRLSDDKGDADYTVALGDPNIIAYQTALTAPRTITLPTVGNDLTNGVYYEVVVNGASPTATNTLTIKAATTNLLVLTGGKVVVGFTYRRNNASPSNAAGGWVMTKYETLP